MRRTIGEATSAKMREYLRGGNGRLRNDVAALADELDVQSYLFERGCGFVRDTESELEITGLACDSSKVKPGYLFFS